MLPQPFLTARMRLRRIVHSDAPAIFATYAQDPIVTRYLTWRPHQVLADTEAYVARCLDSLTSQTYVMLSRDTGRLLGVFDLRRSGPCEMSCGYVLARPAWGQGLMTEALTAVTHWALGQPSIWRMAAYCDVENQASARVMEKAGMIREAVARRWALHPNISDEPRDCLCYVRVR